MGHTADNKPSIANVAALAGVSTATVSRVLSGHRSKNDDISRRVRTAAEKLNYSANFAASALRSDRSRTVGLVLCGTSAGLDGSILDLLSRRLTEQGRYLLVISVRGDQEREAAIRSMAARQVEGIIVVPSPDDDPVGMPADLPSELPIVQVGGRPVSYHTSWVGMDQAASMRLIIAHLAEQNAHAVAYLSRELSTSAASELFTTFSTLTNTLGMTPQPDWVQFGPCSMQRGHDAVATMLSAGNDHPDAIICGDDSLALGALMACNQLGFQVPDQIKVAAFVDSPACLVSSPTLTAVKTPLEGIVQEALRLVDAKGQSILPSHVALPPALECRESTWSPRIGSSNMTSPGTFA
ncbi:MULTISPECIES: LacI family DNA-binding transcriptional regulator [Bifidobacterium]|uniref:LacI family transcriptional regulator n=1 Tax=Bifidobacterium apousia TaxID=2750996 RepID=A0A556R5B8_9BIFI|nr:MULTISPECIES: LacI family DNA-binding transcriptional regulator [Bifidobacterium]MBI0137275.1 LacI family DNA-binding transcriptional regulator [Bifidobacterium sp. W8120]TSJ84079.1 LacI family transcriptional regulator [Bifidobacterium apousia]